MAASPQLTAPKPYPPKPKIDTDRLAADIYVALVCKFCVMQPTHSETVQLTDAAYSYAGAFVAGMEKRNGQV